tara:strand:- start:113 stop:1261 length:1149 start_codon:yes stop_codon:yes gene_type:complete
MENCLICSSKDWYSPNFIKDKIKNINFTLINDKKKLNLKFLKILKPKFIFFTHWNWKVPKSIYEGYDCIVFHTSSLPYGRGGSPIQNLIMLNKRSSPVCALRMTEEIDAGPIYDKENISLDGNIVDIFERVQNAVDNLMYRIINKKNSPKPQKGIPTIFKRRDESDSEIKSNEDIKNIYNRIRCVDGFNYPRAFIDYGNNRLHFSKSIYHKKYIKSEVIISKKKKKEEDIYQKKLNKNKFDFRFIKMKNSKELLEKSYFLFSKRKKNTKISSREKLVYENHCNFVINHPYRLWYLIECKDSLIGSIYAKFDNTLAINFLNFNRENFKKIIYLFLNVVKPLPSIESITPENFVMNISTGNKNYQRALEQNGFKRIQETFSLVL